MKLYRIGSRFYPLFDGTGAMLHGGRWNSPGSRTIYCAASLAVAQLETLVHIGRAAPPVEHVWIEIDVPDDLVITRFDRADLPVEWDHPTAKDVSQSVGDAWLAAKATSILRVPSVAAAEAHVFVISQDHPDFVRLSATPPRPLVWDTRLFRA